MDFSSRKDLVVNRDKTIGDIAKEGETIVINYTKLNNKIKECRLKENNLQCKKELKDIGIDWIE